MHILLVNLMIFFSRLEVRMKENDTRERERQAVLFMKTSVLGLRNQSGGEESSLRTKLSV